MHEIVGGKGVENRKNRLENRLYVSEGKAFVFVMSYLIENRGSK